MSTTESQPLRAYESRIGFLSGQWVPHESMQLGVDDIGFRQGVTAVERLRTHHGRLFSVDDHLRRWQGSTSKIGIEGLPSPEQTELYLAEMLDRNRDLVAQESDIGVTMFATPGLLGGSAPTFGMHLNRLNHEMISARRQSGQPLVVTEVQQPSAACWPRSIKTRARIHYHLADTFASQHGADSLGVLLDRDGTVTETSTSNLAVVKSGEILSPPADRVLPGITQLMIERLAGDASIAWSKAPVSVAQLASADEVLLMGTDGGIWFASSVNDLSIGDGQPGEIYIGLRDRFDRLVSNGS